MARNIWPQVAAWQGPHPILNKVSLAGPNGRRTLVWETTAGNSVAVIEKIGDEKRGRFVDDQNPRQALQDSRCAGNEHGIHGAHRANDSGVVGG